MAYWRHFSHLVWTTKERQPFITRDIEEKLYGYILGKATNLECIPHVIGGIDDHMHLIVSIPPKIAVADVIRHLKGSSSHYVNHNFPDYPYQFAWQRSYGSLSFGETQLPKAVQYALNQKHHHQAGTIITALEETDEDDNGPDAYMPETSEDSPEGALQVRESRMPYCGDFPF